MCLFHILCRHQSQRTLWALIPVPPHRDWPFHYFELWVWRGWHFSYLVFGVGDTVWPGHKDQRMKKCWFFHLKKYWWSSGCILMIFWILTGDPEIRTSRNYHLLIYHDRRVKEVNNEKYWKLLIRCLLKSDEEIPTRPTNDGWNQTPRPQP